MPGQSLGPPPPPSGRDEGAGVVEDQAGNQFRVAGRQHDGRRAAQGGAHQDRSPGAQVQQALPQLLHIGFQLVLAHIGQPARVAAPDPVHADHLVAGGQAGGEEVEAVGAVGDPADAENQGLSCLAPVGVGDADRVDPAQAAGNPALQAQGMLVIEAAAPVAAGKGKFQLGRVGLVGAPVVLPVVFVLIFWPFSLPVVFSDDALIHGFPFSRPVNVVK